MSVQLQVNQALWVQVVGAADNTGSNCVISSASPERVTIRFPDSAPRPPGLSPGCSVFLRMVNAQGVHTGIANVVQVGTKPHLAATLRAPLKLSTTQKRRFVRVAVKLPVTCTIRASKHAGHIGESDDAAKTHDLSAGGLRLSTGLPLHVGDELALSVKLRNLRSAESELNLSGRVLRVEPGDKKPRPTVHAGIELMYNHQRDQDAVVLLVFELQRKSLA